jgi:hypothetical protein
MDIKGVENDIILGIYFKIYLYIIVMQNIFGSKENFNIFLQLTNGILLTYHWNILK